MATTNPYKDYLADDGLDPQEKLKQYAIDSMAASNEYNRAKSAMNYYSSVGNTDRANAANQWLGQVNTAAGGTLNRPNNDTYNAVNKYNELLSAPREQFNYNPANDVQYQNAMQQALAGAKTASNNAMVGLGSRGIGNSSIAVDRSNQIQQKAVGDVNSNVLPQLIQQAYTRFMDQQNLNQQQLNNYSTLAGLNNDLYQNNFNNKVTESDLTGYYNGNRTMSGQNQDFNQRIAESNVTGTYNPYAGLIGDMNTNSRNWFTSTPEEQQRLAAENQRIGAQIGATQDAQGNWVFPTPQPTYQASRDAVGDQQWNQNYDRGVFESDRNYDRGALESDRTYGLSAAQTAANIANMNEDNARAAQSQTNSSSKTSEPTAMKPSEMSTYIAQLDKRYVDDKGNVKDAYVMRNAIINLDLSDEDTIKLLNYYQLPIEAPTYSGGR